MVRLTVPGALVGGAYEGVRERERSLGARKRESAVGVRNRDASADERVVASSSVFFESSAPPVSALALPAD